MGKIIRMHGDPHQHVLKLLPWYANATLEPIEVAEVEDHLAECAECREELESERALGAAVAGLPIEVDRRWAAMRARVVPVAAPRRNDPIPFFRRRISLGGALAGQAAAASLIGLLFFSLPETGGNPPYRALASAPAAIAEGNIIVLFNPDASEREMRAALVLADARLVGGPTASGAYVVQVPAEHRAAAVERLQSIDQIVLAEPIEPDSVP